MYYLVRAKYNEQYDQTERFLEDKICQNGSHDKFLDIIKSIKKDDIY